MTMSVGDSRVIFSTEKGLRRVYWGSSSFLELELSAATVRLGEIQMHTTPPSETAGGPQRSARFTANLVRSTLVAALGGLLFGFDTAVIAGTTAALRQVFHLSVGALGFAVASALIGTVFGALLSGKPGDRFGRRDSLKATGLLFFVSGLGCALAWNLESLVVFRFLGGLGIGAASVLGPMYLAEIAPAQWRGRLVGFFQFNIVLGILLAYLSNYLLGQAGLGAAEWRWKLGVNAVPAALFFVMLFTIPRSPRWLVKQGRVDEARTVLRLVGEPDVENELADIVHSVEHERGRKADALFQRAYRLPIFLAVSIAVFNQLSGINALLYYLNDIFAAAGFNKVSSDLQAVAIGATNLVFTMIAMSVIDKIGRKVLLLVGSVGTAFCLAGVAFIFFTQQHQHLLVWLLVGYIACFAFSQGAVIWVYISEVFPNRVRAQGQALGSFTHWFMCALVTFTFPILAKTSGGYPFVFFSVMMVVQLVVVWLAYPETKGITLEELQRKLRIEGAPPPRVRSAAGGVPPGAEADRP